MKVDLMGQLSPELVERVFNLVREAASIKADVAAEMKRLYHDAVQEELSLNGISNRPDPDKPWEEDDPVQGAIDKYMKTVLSTQMPHASHPLEFALEHTVTELTRHLLTLPGAQIKCGPHKIKCGPKPPENPFSG